MGNSQSNCCSSNAYFDVDNSQEEKIRESLQIVMSKLKNYNEIKEIIYDTFQTTLIDIDSVPLEWITKPLYQKFLKSVFDSKSEPLSKPAIRSISMNYDDVNISSKSYKENFNLLILIWLLFLMNSSKIETKEKIEKIKEIIVKNSKVLTFGTFSLFLKTSLELMLCDITMSFADENQYDIEYSKLVNEVYNITNINEYHKWIMGKLKKIIIKDKPKLSNESKFINEFITDSYLFSFFDENSFLLNALDLRVNFYNKYSIIHPSYTM